MGDRMTVGGRETARPPTVTRTPRGRRRSRAGSAGAVTAEAAAVLPLLVAVALGLVWVLGLTVAQVRLVDAARDVAREVARGDSVAGATGKARPQAPAGTTFTVRHSGDRVVVGAAVEVHGPGGLFTFLPGVHLTTTATTAEEPGEEPG